MAQSFLVNSATRLHPVEFSIGQSAGVVGTYAVQNNLPSVAEVLKEKHLRRVQSIVKQFTQHHGQLMESAILTINFVYSTISF